MNTEIRELYKWLGTVITDYSRTANMRDTPDATSLALSCKADALADVREHLRGMFPALRTSAGVDDR